MKSSRHSLPDRRGPIATALVGLFWAAKAGALYAIIVFLISFYPRDHSRPAADPAPG
jgi:hypothetical protein